MEFCACSAFAQTTNIHSIFLQTHHVLRHNKTDKRCRNGAIHFIVRARGCERGMSTISMINEKKRIRRRRQREENPCIRVEQVELYAIRRKRARATTENENYDCRMSFYDGKQASDFPLTLSHQRKLSA